MIVRKVLLPLKQYLMTYTCKKSDSKPMSISKVQEETAHIHEIVYTNPDQVNERIFADCTGMLQGGINGTTTRWLACPTMSQNIFRSRVGSN